MANFEEKVTSNFFKVKDPKLFINEIEEKQIECFYSWFIDLSLFMNTNIYYLCHIHNKKQIIPK